MVFKRARASIKDDPREERTKTATTEENNEKIHNMVLDQDSRTRTPWT